MTISEALEWSTPEIVQIVDRGSVLQGGFVNTGLVPEWKIS